MPKNKSEELREHLESIDHIPQEDQDYAYRHLIALSNICILEQLEALTCEVIDIYNQGEGL